MLHRYKGKGNRSILKCTLSPVDGAIVMSDVLFANAKKQQLKTPFIKLLGMQYVAPISSSHEMEVYMQG